MARSSATAISDAVGAERLCQRISPATALAIERFRLARGLVLLLTVSGASAAYHGGIPPKGAGPFGLALACLVVAIGLYRFVRRGLLARLESEARQNGHDESEARVWARSMLDRLLRAEPAASDTHEGRTMQIPVITVTETDLERLGALLDTVGPLPGHGVERLDEELARAHVVPSCAVDPDVVTMNSKVRYLEEPGGASREITLVYPSAADAGDGRVSVLAPVGSALLGLRVGQSIEWPLPDGRRKRYRVLAVPYQPEAAGHFHL